MKKLLQCPNCEKMGFKMILGEITGQGTISVMRFQQGFTVIAGKEFVIICGKCSSTIYHHAYNLQEAGTIMNKYE